MYKLAGDPITMNTYILQSVNLFVFGILGGVICNQLHSGCIPVITDVYYITHPSQ